MRIKLFSMLILSSLISFCLLFLTAKNQELTTNTVSAQTTQPSSTDWYMAGANPQRTSWVGDTTNSTNNALVEVKGNLNVEWYQPIEPYIPYNFQPVFYNDRAYVATSKGLYVFNLTDGYSNSDNGRVEWIYPTELPYGNSPTIAIVNGKTVVYIASLDHTIHAIDISTHQPLTGYVSYQAEAGFSTNPVIVDNMILAGNRDGYFYAFNATTGVLLWRYQTGDAIMFSAAYKDNTVYFASNDLYAYALNVSDGTLRWKSQKFQYSSGFQSYWPVIYTDKVSGEDYVIFSGAANFRPRENNITFNSLEAEYFVPGCQSLPGPACPNNILWNTSIANNDSNFLDGTTLMDVNGTSTVPGITSYFETLPDRRMVFVLKTLDGNEYAFDSNNNGITEYAPFNWAVATYTGNRYPGLVSSADNIYYQTTVYYGGNWISRGDPVGWKFGSHQVSRVSGTHHAWDEPIAYSGGGDILYWSLCCDREAGAYDITLPLATPNRSWNYYTYDLINKAPDYHPMYNDGDTTRYNDMDGWHTFSGKNQSKNGVYGKHGITQSPPIPYQGKVYMLKGNTLFAWKETTATPMKLALAPITPVNHPPAQTTASELTSKLEIEIQKMITAGHLRPGYYVSSLLNNLSTNYSNWLTLGESLDYFSNPSETVYTLLHAYPHLSPALQLQVKTYLQNYYGPGKTYDITTIQHIGWGTGAAREFSTIPPETYTAMTNKNPTSWKPCCAGGTWNFSPLNFYAAWKYAQIVGNNDTAFARTIFDSMSSKIEAPISDAFLIDKPYFTNIYAAGYYGYLQLKQLAGLGGDTIVQGYYDKVLNLRTVNFTKDTPYWPDTIWCGTTNNCANYQRAFSVSRNFAFLTPEIANYMSSQIQPQVQEAVNEYQYVAPYWFVSKFENTIGEGTLQQLYDSTSLLQAKAYILNQSYAELVKWIDTPAFAVGDLFYIQNLVAVLEAPTDGSVTTTPTPTPLPGDVNGDRVVNILDYTLLSNNFGTSNTDADLNSDGMVNILDYTILSNKFGTSG